MKVNVCLQVVSSKIANAKYLKRGLIFIILISLFAFSSCTSESSKDTSVDDTTEKKDDASQPTTYEEKTIQVEPKKEYENAMILASEGKRLEAMSIFMRIYDYEDSYKQYKMLLMNNRITTGAECSAIVKDDGSVFALGSNYHGQMEVSDWTGINSIASHAYGLIGLKNDGTVVATKDVKKVKEWYAGAELLNEDWVNIIEVSCGSYHTVGLKKDGTVISTKYLGNQEFNKGQYNVQKWTDIVSISAGGYHTLGLKNDGTVIACGDNEKGQCEVDEWNDIVAISAGSYCSLGLKKDGTVVCTGEFYTSNWIDIVEISAGSFHIVGLKKDGTVISLGSNNNGEIDVQSWSNMICVVAGSSNSIGVKDNGGIIAIGNKSTGKLEMNDHNLFTGELGEVIKQPISLPDDFPKNIPLYKNSELLKVENVDDSLVIVFETDADYDDAFNYYEELFSERGGYIKQPFTGDLEMLSAPIHDIEKSVSVIVTKGITLEDGTTSKKCGVIIMLQGGEFYKKVSDIK